MDSNFGARLESYFDFYFKSRKKEKNPIMYLARASE
jgi:hypothetical protein